MNQHSRPIWFAVLVTPWAVPLAFVLWSTISIGVTAGSFKDWPWIIIIFIYCLPPAYAAILMFGLPYVLWLRSRRALTFFHVCIGAVLASVVVVPVYSALIDPKIPPTAVGVLSFAALGLLSGMVFCIAAGIALRPNRPLTGAA